MEFKAQKVNGKIDINWDKLSLYVARWNEGEWFEIDITRRQKRKSDPMRKYYFSTVLPLFAQHLGYEPDEEMLLHRQLKITYFKIEPDKKGIYRKVPSIYSDDSDIIIPEKKKFQDWVIRKAAQSGVYIPDPKGKDEPSTEKDNHQAD